MILIISPAKKMNLDIDSLPYETLPAFLNETTEILKTLRTFDYASLKKLWACNDSIATLNTERVREMDITRRLTPALLAYEGIQYQYMAPHVFEDRHFEYIKTHLRILSGFYGVLRPFDGVTPYRLEMQAKLKVNGYQNLYRFWGKKLALHLAKETDLIINLASKEYSRSIEPHLPKHVKVITCEFSENINGKRIEKATLCKMARGEMVRYMAENQIETPDGIKYFNRLDYAYDENVSTDTHYVFIKRPTLRK
ncbi:peroxide stress protein YaaA [Fusibacter paucivorans]|uniref:UPF0246 protein KHM83_14155 n=1 Tax=Fusibacter paucivorans TaxID=76009 RepID=A0ABS5PTV8_9FIRM|nr:peroxide stress protein YaaA [Fusibacter paucivorans]MBS7527824.1 peroxide stress protein YaaA [Fusibacter paucivorans]